MDTRVKEARVRLRDRLGCRVVHQNDLAGFALGKVGEGVKQAVEACCRRIGIVDCAGPPLGEKGAGAVREEEHLAGVGDGNDAHGVWAVRVDDLLDKLGAYAADTDDSEVERMLRADFTHICACRIVGGPILGTTRWKY